MMRIWTIFCLCFFLAQILFAQTNSGSKQDSISLLKGHLLKTSLQADSIRQGRVAKYLFENGGNPKFRDSFGNLVVLNDVDEFGIPQFFSTDNNGAAVTTGASNLRDGSLGLEGDGLTVGIWDGGGIGHIEFGSRILSSQGNSDVHANHVAGTILASGLNNISAKGMAPKAKALTFDFANDLSEMSSASLGEEGSLLLSNHSYGLITGWRFDNGWTWFGNAQISTLEDHRFGFYSSNAANWDQLAVNSPNYLMVKSAGNDRSDAGNNASRPPDCNGGSGFDCISDVSTAKNILVVGAVAKVPNYVGASSVGMSTFSSWGPTDDGRIKPDLVAAGVGLFSTSSNNGYTTLSGTSMSSPNATGSLLLLQEHYKKLNAGSIMSSATLKALALHTTKEAGQSDGPDYKFGWGLLDVSEAANFLSTVDGVSKIVTENVLSSGQVFSYKITPKANTKIKVTIVWTDPAGTPVPASLDPPNLMLVNDLDLRLHDDVSIVEFPWILNPLSPDDAATKGDNFRDNVEKLEFNSALERNYYVQVSNKGVLSGGQQKFSLVVEYTPLEDDRTVFYWIGGSGNWSDQNHWSISSGGNAASIMPTLNDRVFFDENSSLEDNDVITFSENVSCGSFSWFTKQQVNFDFNQKELEIANDIFINSPSLKISTAGRIVLLGTKPLSNTVSLGNSDFGLVQLVFNGANTWTLNDLQKVGGINVLSGNVILLNSKIQLANLDLVNGENGYFDFSGSELHGLTSLKFPNNSEAVKSTNSLISFSTNVTASARMYGFLEGKIVTGAPLVIFDGDFTCKEMEINGEVDFSGDTQVLKFSLSGGSNIRVAAGKKLRLTKNFFVESTAIKRVGFSSFGGGFATLEFEESFKACLDFLDISNVSISGSNYINAGLNSVLSNSPGWLKLACNDVLFPNFDVKFACVNSLVEINNLSEGDIEEYIWDFGSPDVSNLVPQNTKYPRVIYNEEGEKTISLTVKTDNFTATLSKSFVIKPNVLQKPIVIASEDKLFSSLINNSYEWLDNYVAFPGENSRIFNFQDKPGDYMVVVSNGQCNAVSDPFIVASIETQLQEFSVYPNPAFDQIFVNPSNDIESLSLYNIVGQFVTNLSISASSLNSYDMSSYREGMYFLVLRSKKGKIETHKIILKK